ncbi:MAG: SH3 domain-containing protein [Saprospiraceae bacterium]|nr:SH3 domain-containing protein [Saprospiraceae bacterium]
MVMKQAFALLFLLSFQLDYLLAGEAETLFAEGNKAYKEKAYDKAIATYEELINQGYKSADLEYNLGNAWYRQGSVGQAVLHFERALVLDGNHEQATKNLAFLRSKINADIEPLPAFFMTEWWRFARMALGANSMGIIAMLFWWTGFVGLAVWAMGKTREHKKWGLIAGVTLLIISILPFALSMSRKMYEGNTAQAILIQKTAILRTGPNEGSQEVETIAEGTKLRQLAELEGWWQVSLENGEIGWIPESALERI